MDLPLLERPNSAILGAFYRLEQRDFVSPRHSGYDAFGKQRVHAPVQTCAPEFRQLFNGYVAANSAVYARDAREPLHMITADEAELKASLACHGQNRGEDASQRPRPLSVWLLLPDAMQPGATAQNRRYLDGLATWCTENELVRHARFNVAAGVDAVDFVKRTESDRVSSCEVPRYSARVAVRWCTPEGAMRMEMRVLPAAHDGIDAQARLQCAVATLCVEHGAPLHANGYASVSEGASRNVDGAFVRMVRHVAASFDAVVNGCACITRSSFLSKADGPLQFTGVFVRVVARDAPPVSGENLTFHGVILAPACKHAQVQQYCASHGGALPAPRGVGEELLGMHLCAVYVEERALADAVSLYGLDGIPGRPIRRPGSSVLASVPFLRPVDDGLCRSFVLKPCSAASMLPAETALHDGFANFFERCVQLYTDTSGAPEEDATRIAPARAPTPPPLDPQSQFVLSALRINLRSERITVGDALCHLFSSGAPRAIITLLINAVRHRGVNMPLSDMLGECAELLGGVTRSTSAVVEENEKLKKLALVSLTFSPPACETASAGDDGEVGTLNDETMRRVMMACRLRRGKRSLLVRRGAATQWSRAVAAIAEALSTQRSLSLATIEHAEAILQRGLDKGDGVVHEAHEWARRVDCMTGAAIEVVAASRDVPLESVFVLHKNNDRPVVLQQLTDRGVRVRCGLDTLLRTTHPRVLEVHRGVGAVRLVACTGP